MQKSKRKKKAKEKAIEAIQRIINAAKDLEKAEREYFQGGGDD